MKVLFINNNSSGNLELSRVHKLFEGFCENEDVIVRNNLQDAKEYLQNFIIAPQKHLDLIITHWNFGNRNSKEIVDWLRVSEENYSSQNFIFRSIPILLIEDTDNHTKEFERGFDWLIKDFPENLVKLNDGVYGSVKTWRSFLADDLRRIGLNLKEQLIYSRKRFTSYDSLHVLSRRFVESKTTFLNYIWTDPNLIFKDQINEQFDNLIRKQVKEKEFHKFFLQQPTLVKGEDFYRTGRELLYEPQLNKVGRKRDIPDFINRPFAYSLRNPEIFEVKLPTERFLRRDKFCLLYKAKKNFRQVKRYQGYMNSSDILHQQNIIHHLGQIHNSYDYTLLMGSKDEKLEHLDLIERLKGNFDFSDIKLITYEELLERHVRLVEHYRKADIFEWH